MVKTSMWHGSLCPWMNQGRVHFSCTLQSSSSSGILDRTAEAVVRAALRPVAEDETEGAAAGAAMSRGDLGSASDDELGRRLPVESPSSKNRLPSEPSPLRLW